MKKEEIKEEKEIPRCRTRTYKNFYCSRKCLSEHIIGKHFSPKTEFKKGIIYNPDTVFKKGMKKQDNAYKFPKGDKHPGWKGGISPIRLVIWSSQEYKQWRKLVFERDDYICQICGQKGGRLEAHHLIPVSSVLKDCATIKEAMKIKEIFDVENGLTLCKECHRSIGHKNIKDRSIFNKSLLKEYCNEKHQSIVGINKTQKAMVDKLAEEGTRHWESSKHCWGK